jgi:hypothetical protein
MARSSRKMVFTEEPVDSIDELLAAATPTPGQAPRPSKQPPPPPLEPNHRDDPLPYDPPGDHQHPHPDPLKNPANNIGEGDDSDVANPDVPGSTPRHPHPKPEELGDPTPDPDPADPSREKGELERERESIHRAQRPNIQLDEPVFIHHGEVMPKNARYEARITILDAFHYPGNLKGAPEWVDRNWVGYGDDDPLRGITAGPCLRVPKHNVHEDVVLARIGDYVTRQEVRLAPNVPGDIRVEVWAREQFEKMFLPVIQ